jgi:glycosyltransferase involved in cell wall biosynthesis
VAGDGELRDPLTVTAEQQGVPLHILGFCNQTEMPAAYAAADCLVLPSDARETWGLVANEALACGKPIVVSDACGCHPDLTANPRVGRMFPMGDVAALAQAISETLAAPADSDALGAITQLYSLDASARGIVSAFNSVTVGRRA